MKQKLNCQGFSHKKRNKSIEEVKETISRSEGWIVNFSMFSDLALSLSIEIEEAGIPALYESLSQILQLSDFDVNSTKPGSKKEWLILMNISFTKGTGDLKMNIPDVPG